MNFIGRDDLRHLDPNSESTKAIYKILEECFFDMADYSEKESSWGAKEIVKEANAEKSKVTDEIMDQLNDVIGQDIDTYGECVAYVSYDEYGMGHSGINSIYKFGQSYVLHGSDYIEGPDSDPLELLRFLDWENDSHNVYLDDEIKALIKAKYESSD